MGTPDAQAAPHARRGTPATAHPLLRDDFRHGAGRIFRGDHRHPATGRRTRSRTGARGPHHRSVAMSSRSPWSSERRSAYAMVAPAILVLAAVAVYPVLAGMWLSLHRAI